MADSFLFACPARLPLFQESGNPFLSVRGQSVHAHYLFGVGISLRLVEIDLGVERLLAERDGQRTGFGHARRQLAGLLSSSEAGTAMLMRPHSTAVKASTMSPVISICKARLRPTARLRATIGVVQNRPILTPGVANAAWSEATARSHVATSWQPAAVATPCTCAITGCGMD